ncbi:MAG: zf-HC2 domain-containing protein [Candidatus Acidiferrales bacterium]|jgi:anti-sigma factor RsiW
MDWNCTATEERLSDFLEGTLVPEEAAAFSAHIAGCLTCARIVAQVGGLLSRMQQLAPVQEPALLAGRILDATLGPPTRVRGWRQWFGWVPTIWQPRFAMGVATAAASFVILFHAVVPDARSVSLADFKLAALMRTANRQVHLSYARGAKFVNDLRVVYEIQSRLGSQPEPEHPSRDPQDKSQTNPSLDQHQAPVESVLGFAVANRWSEASPNTTRSRP